MWILCFVKLCHLQLLECFKKYPFRQITPPATEEITSKSPTAATTTSRAAATDTTAKSTSSHTVPPVTSSPSSSSSQLASTALPPTPPQPVNNKHPTVQHNPENGKQIPIGNGGYTENYYWTQTLNEVTVYVDVPTGTRGKQVDCVMKPRSLSLAVKGHDVGTLLAGALEDVVRLDESM